MKLGRYDVSIHNFGNFKLDGGAMFGSVPKNLWSKKIKGDKENRILLATNSLIIKGDERVILVDVGMGEKWDEKAVKIYAIEQNPLPSDFDPAQVTDVILTHLHFDHAGGISRINAAGALELVYPNAKVHLQRRNYETAKNPTIKERASYLRENYELLEGDKLNLLDGESEIFPGIRVFEANGHTLGQQYVEVSDHGKAVIFATDVIPTSHHLPLPYTMGYDMCADTLLKEKTGLLARADNENAIIVFQHDTETPAAKVKLDEKGRYIVVTKESL